MSHSPFTTSYDYTLIFSRRWPIPGTIPEITLLIGAGSGRDKDNDVEKALYAGLAALRGYRLTDTAPVFSMAIPLLYKGISFRFGSKGYDEIHRLNYALLMAAMAGLGDYMELRRYRMLNWYNEIEIGGESVGALWFRHMNRECPQVDD